jgi:hypothetical protein
MLNLMASPPGSYTHGTKHIGGGLRLLASTMRGADELGETLFARIGGVLPASG